jgi:type III pantothenate kinase
VDSEGTFQGGLIAPGFRLGARALSQAAARLPMIELRAPQTVIGRSTREAMQSGVVYGEVARVDGLLDMVANELGEQPPVVLTGDGASVIAALLRHEATVDEDLTLRGLYLLWKANRR